jgi:LysM repeat protein
MGERQPGVLARLITTRWLPGLVGLLIGGVLAVWVFLSFGVRPSVPPVARPSIEATQATLADVPTDIAAPQAAAPAAVPTEEPSPFAGIAQPPPEPAPRTGMITHTVAEGDVLWQVAEHYGLRSETLLWVNDLDDPNLLLIGQQLTIPPRDGVLYTVRPGDSLADVAIRYGVDVQDILRLNPIDDVNQVQAGVDIFLPGARPLAPSPAPAQIVQDSASGQEAAALPPIPLPDNVEALLAAGWLRAQHVTDLYRGPETNSGTLHQLPGGARLERLDGVRGGRILVRDPGDGRTRQAMTGWVNAMDLDIGRAPTSRELPLAYPADTAMDISHVFAPYRSQLDGSPFAEANCGPTAVGMALSAFGIDVPARQLRAAALDAQHMYGNGVGTLITALGSVVEQHGLSAVGLYEDGALKRWSADDLRAHVRAGQPVIVQVRYRSLPGRGGVYYFGDHYILVTGVVGDGFLYNDPIDVDGLGWDRVISADRLRVAMDASDRRYSFSAFAVSR